MISVRRYRIGEEEQLRALFYNTVRHINSRDYTQEQVTSWVPEEYQPEAWKKRIQSLTPFVALVDDQIAGFADIQEDGLIDLFFCAKDYQGQGVGRLLMETLFKEGAKMGVSRFYSHVSITAKPFFERMGFAVLKAKQAEIRGVKLNNYLMERVCSK